MPKSLKLSLLALSVVLVIGTFLGMRPAGVSAAIDTYAGDDPQQAAATQATGSQNSSDGAYKQINVYSEVLEHIQSDYVEDPNMPSVTSGALRGLLESLDADSSYLSPADYKAYKAHMGGKAQVGINVSKRFDYAVVVSVVPGSAADKAGLDDGDIIEAIGSMDTRNLSLATIKQMLEGAPGSQLTLAVVRPRKADPDKIVLTRSVIVEPPVTDSMLEGSTILDLRPAVIDAQHVNAVESRLKAMAKSGGDKKVILDLRDVSTGEMAEGVRLANFFVKSGTLATLEGQKVPKQTFTADPGKTLDATASLVVLVNRGTAGAAELVAAAIGDNKRGDVVGERTFGEGAQQKTFELPDGAALILSVAKYASPAGKRFEDDAVIPGTLVASNLDAMDDGAEEAPAATPDATKAVSAPKQSTSAKRAAAPSDDQLNKAVEILKGKAA